MSYTMYQRETQFRIPDYLKHVAYVHVRERLYGNGSSYSYVDDRDLAVASTIEDWFRAFMWKPVVDQGGNIVGLKYAAPEHKMGDEEALFDTVARFVNRGSYINMVPGDYEDDGPWRWYFDGEHCLNQPATTTYG
jgi:hypothetical protein